MPTTALDSTNPTYLDLIKSQNPDGSAAKIVEILQRACPLMQFLNFQQGNLDTGHRVSVETALPSVGYVAFNEGVESGKYETGQFDEQCGMMEGKSTLDFKLFDLNGGDAYRARYDMKILRSFQNEIETGMFYNSTATSPRRWNGLAPRYANLSSASIPFSGQVIDSSVAGGTGNDQTSVWLIHSSPETVFGIVPKGQGVGLKTSNMGVQMVPDAAGNTYRAYQTVWNWNVGLCVADGEAVVRIANVDTGSIVGTGQLLIDDLDTAWFRLPNRVKTMPGRIAWFMNSTLAEYLHKQAKASTASSTLSIKTDLITGQEITHYMGKPIFISDQIVNTEAPIA
jgi:hypothetical protein